MCCISAVHKSTRRKTVVYLPRCLINSVTFSSYEALCLLTDLTRSLFWEDGSRSRYIGHVNSVLLKSALSDKNFLSATVSYWARYSDWLRAGRFGDRNPVGGEIFRTWDPPSLLYNGHRVFPGGKERPGRDADPSPPSSAVVMKE
jgi:hypothetical protein